jgi:hypothetical protein
VGATNVPTTLSYGGNYFDITIQPSSDTSIADDAAKSTTIWLIRQGFTKHAMNMGQRIMQINNTFTVQNNGDDHFAHCPADFIPDLIPAWTRVSISIRHDQQYSK